MALKRQGQLGKKTTKKVVNTLKFTKLTKKKFPAVVTANRVKTSPTASHGVNPTLILQEIKTLMTEIQTKLQKLDY